jgi:hypothetical protein
MRDLTVARCPREISHTHPCHQHDESKHDEERSGSVTMSRYFSEWIHPTESFSGQMSCYKCESPLLLLVELDSRRSCGLKG